MVVHVCDLNYAESWSRRIMMQAGRGHDCDTLLEK
jgi:hypothetical protein